MYSELSNQTGMLKGKVTGSKIILSSPWFNQSLAAYVQKYTIYYMINDNHRVHYVRNTTIVSSNSREINNVEKNSNYRLCLVVEMHNNWTGPKPPSGSCIYLSQNMEIELSAIIGAILGVIFALLLILLLIIISRYQHKVARKLQNNAGGGNYFGPGYSNDENTNGECYNDTRDCEKNSGKNKNHSNSHNNHYSGSGFFSKGGNHGHGGLKLGRGYHSGSGNNKSNNNNNQRRRFDSTFDSTFDSIAMREEDTSFYEELLLMSESSVYDMSSYYGNAGGMCNSGVGSVTTENINNCMSDNPAGVYCVAGSSATVISQSVRPPIMKEIKPVTKEMDTVSTMIDKESAATSIVPMDSRSDTNCEDVSKEENCNKDDNGCSNAMLPNSNPTIQRQNSIEILHETSIDEFTNTTSLATDQS